MKKLKYFVLLCLVAIISTGCVKYNATMKINKDKSMDFTIIYALDKSLMSMGGESSGLKEEDFEEVKKTGFTVEKYSEDNYEGFKMTKKINNIDEVSTDQDVVFSLSGMMKNAENNKYMFKVVKGDEKNTYYAKFTFDSNDSSLSGNEDEDDDEDDDILDGDMLADEDDTLTVTGSEDTTTIGGSDDGNGGMDLSGLTDSMDLSFKVNLPNAAISSNATNKENDNKDLTWKLSGSGSQTIEFAFELEANPKSDSNLILYIGIGVGVLLVLALLIFLLTRKKGNKEVVPVVDNKVEVNNTVNEAVQQQPVVNQEPQVVNQEPIVSEQSQVVNETEQKDA